MAGSNAIVFPTDFSDLSLQSLPIATKIAAAFDANVHFLYVVEVPYVYATLEMGPIALPSEEELIESANTRFKQLSESHSIPKGSVIKVLSGRPSEEIVHYANEIKAAMIVMTTHGYSGVKHLMLGSTTEAVLRHATCPVLSVRAK